VTRWLGLVLLVYLPHLVEEALTGMYDDPIIAYAFAPLAHLSPRHATYLVFQAMLLLLLATAWLTSLAPHGPRVVLALLGVALLAESHHVVRAIGSHAYNSGLVTSVPMPIVGALAIAHAFSASPFSWSFRPRLLPGASS
jgi:hypothetical protein